MKNTYSLLIALFACTFLFFSCGQTGVLDWDESAKTNAQGQNDQGEDEDPGKNPPVVVPPKDDEFQSIPFRVSASRNDMGLPPEGHDLFTIVRSKEDLNRAAETRYHQIWTITGGPYTVYYLGEIAEKYDEDFFTENTLVLYLFGAVNFGGKTAITQMQRQGSELTIITDFHKGALNAASFWTVVIEVTPADVDGVTTLKSRNDCNCPRFTFNLVIVVLTHEATVAAYYGGKTYTPADFPEFNFSRVENLFTPEPPINPDMRRMLFLYLAEPSEENVLKAVELIGQRTDVSSAGLNYILGF